MKIFALHASRIREVEIRFENDYFPDTEGVVSDAAAVEGEEESDDIEESAEGNESMKNDLKDLFINDVIIYSLSLQ